MLNDFQARPEPDADPQSYSKESGDEPLTALVGHTVIAANAIVTAWAMLYAAISGHSLPYVASLFDKWAREDVQRERLARLAREYLQKLPRELEQVENLLSTAEGLARERELLVGQPWSLGNLDEHDGGAASSFPRSDVAMEREAQFEALLSSLHELHREINDVVGQFRISRDVEKLRVLNRSAVLAAEFKFTRKTTRTKSGPRRREWHTSSAA